MNVLLLATIISMTVLTTLILILIYESPSEEEFFSYDPRYAKLVTIEPSAMIAKTEKIIPQRTCFDINNNTQGLSKEFTDELHTASQAPENQAWEDDILPAHRKESILFINTKDALGFLDRYNFTEHVSQNSYQYTCFFNYQQKQYVILFGFDTRYPIDGSTVDVNFAKDKTILNSDITIYRDFNGTVLFHNDLDHDVTLAFTFREPQRGPDNILIPQGQTVPYPFGLYSYENSATYPYLIKPDNLQGTVTVKNPEGHCISMPEARSLYSQINMTLKFPQYLPDGYVHKCSVVMMSSEIVSFYDKNNISIDAPIPYSNRENFLKNGGLELDYMKTNSVDYDRIKTEIKESKENNQPPTFNYTEINGNPARIYSRGSLTDNDVVINQITVYTKNSFASITGNLTTTELIKIAQSLDEK